MTYLTALLISMFVTIALIPIFRSLAVRVDLVDLPDQRKVHQAPMPKIGGLAMAMGILVPAMLWLEKTPFVLVILTGAGVIVIFGIVDDVKTLGYKTKLAGQLIATLIVVFAGNLTIDSFGDLLPAGMTVHPTLSVFLTVIVIIGVTNAINLSDGLDGLAGGISMLSFMCIGYLGYVAGIEATGLIAIAVVGAILGFLRFNTYPATIFMGDTGSQLLGFLAITLSIKITQGVQLYSPLLPLVILGFPILDTLTVMAERIARGRSPFMADKNHFHHKLMRLGLYHTEAVFVIYVLQSLLVTAAFLLRFHSEWTLLILYVGISGTMIAAFMAADRFGWRIARYDFLDRAIKGRLRFLKDRHVLIKTSFRTLKYGLPALFVVAVFVPDRMPGYFPYVPLALAVLITWSRLFNKEWMGTTIRIGLYMTIPFLIYLGQNASEFRLGLRALIAYDIGFGVIALFMVLTLKFTRRQKGFKSTPMDFLVLFVALVVPNLLGTHLQIQFLGMFAVRVIVFLFGYEVLLGELRGEFDGVGLMTIVALMILGGRGIFTGLGAG